MQILKESLKFYIKNERILVKIGGNKYKITMTDGRSVIENLLKNDSVKEVILITGLARPWSGDGKIKFETKRCYVMIIGLLEIPGNDNSDIKQVHESLKKLKII